MANTEEEQINGINDYVIEKNPKVSSNNITIYILFSIIIIILISSVIFLYLSLKPSNEANKSEEKQDIIYDTEKNAQLIIDFFKDGYQYKNFDKVLDYMVENYIDNSPAQARSNQDAVNILKSVQSFFTDIIVEILDLTCDKNMVAARIWYKVKHIGNFNNIPATGKTITFEALENFKVVNGKIVESWGYWPDKEIESKLLANDSY